MLAKKSAVWFAFPAHLEHKLHRVSFTFFTVHMIGHVTVAGENLVVEKTNTADILLQVKNQWSWDLTWCEHKEGPNKAKLDQKENLFLFVINSQNRTQSCLSSSFFLESNCF